MIGDMKSTCLEAGDQITGVTQTTHHHVFVTTDRLLQAVCSDCIAAVTHCVDNTVQLGHSNHRVCHVIYYNHRYTTIIRTANTVFRGT